MARVKYYTKSGELVPGVTTITGELGWNKQALIMWANRLGMDGKDCNKFKDDKAQIGSLAHEFIMNFHKKLDTLTDDYTQNQIKSANNSLNSYKAWLKGKTLEPILLETPLISELYKFGGTLDNYCKLDGKNTLLDYKTGSSIYLEYYIQVAGAYRQLLIENGHPVDQTIILNVPRTEDESFQFKPVEKVDICWEIFKKSLEIYRLRKELS